MQIFLSSTGFHLHYFWQLWPEKFQNKTNGVTPRRWIRFCNPDLSRLITKCIGTEDWVKNTEMLVTLQKVKCHTWYLNFKSLNISEVYYILNWDELDLCKLKHCNSSKLSGDVSVAMFRIRHTYLLCSSYMDCFFPHWQVTSCCSTMLSVLPLVHSLLIMKISNLNGEK